MRQQFETLWEQYKPYSDHNFLKAFQFDFYQRWWEMYLAVGLLRLKHKLVRQERSRGPDVCITLKNCNKIWLEATAPTPGTTDDRVPEVNYAKCIREFPEEECLLRLAQGISDKREKFEKYVRDGIVSKDDCSIIAISACSLHQLGPDLDASYPVPLAFLAGAGERKVKIGKFATHSYIGSRNYIERKSGSLVNMNVFNQTKFKLISAVLYSNIDPFNAPIEPETTFHLFLNPQAKKSLSQNFTRTFECYSENILHKDGQKEWTKKPPETNFN